MGKPLNDEAYMSRAIDLAQRGAGWTSPNPLVGAVIVKDGRIIGEGWHHKYGDLHAERDALKNCTEDPAGATIYVTLEPCCHHGKQPPCTEALIEAGIRRVVMGSGDPNPLVAGEGIRILRDHGITVDEDVLEPECRSINDIFFHFITTGRPYVAMKYAMTMDGKIACFTGASKWVTGEKAREHVQTLRNRYRGIMVGIGTVLVDDPMLNCRIPGGRSPVRIICDSQLRTPLDSQIVRTAGEYETIIATCVEDPERYAPYEKQGVTVLCVPEDRIAGQQDPSGMMAAERYSGQQDNPQKPEADERFGQQVDLDQLLRELGERKIDSILLEGGAQLNWSMVAGGHVNKVYTYIAPKIFGGASAKSPVGGDGFPDPADALHMKVVRTACLGDDLLIESTISDS